MPSKKIVYYDENYPCCWIDHKKASEIANFLRQKDFEILSADDLGVWMKKVIVEETNNTVVVFSLDIAPDTVLDDPSSNALVKQFLDTGGRIIWIADVPFFRRGRKGSKSVSEMPDEDQNFWRTGAPASILGINPVSSTPIEAVKMTVNGSEMGLRATWSGLRPIAVDRERIWKRLFAMSIPKDRRIKVLAKSRSLVAYPWIRSEKKWRFGIHRVEVSVTPKIEIAPTEAAQELQVYWETYANAWHKNFDNKFPLSGFIRIWDYSPRILTPTMLEDLHSIATYGLEQKGARTNSP
jgi:hypothetical protein